MNSFILGFQRLVWCPKWTPASSSSFMVMFAKLPPYMDCILCGTAGPARDYIPARNTVSGGKILVPLHCWPEWNGNLCSIGPILLPLRELEACSCSLLPVLL